MNVQALRGHGPLDTCDQWSVRVNGIPVGYVVPEGRHYRARSYGEDAVDLCEASPEAAATALVDRLAWARAVARAKARDGALASLLILGGVAALLAWAAWP